MIRGTVQPFKIILPCLNTELEWIKIRFSQSNNPNLPIIKQKEDCGPRNTQNAFDGTNVLYVTLSAYDTAQFSDKYKAKMQLRAKPIDGMEFGMLEQLITVYPMPDDLIDPDIVIPEASDDWVVFDGGSIISH